MIQSRVTHVQSFKTSEKLIFLRGWKITPKCRRIENSISKTLKVNYSGQNGSILACNTNFPLKIKCSFVWNRFSPGKKDSGKIPVFCRTVFWNFCYWVHPKRGVKLYIFGLPWLKRIQKYQIFCCRNFWVFNSTVIMLWCVICVTSPSIADWHLGKKENGDFFCCHFYLCLALSLFFV